MFEVKMLNDYLRGRKKLVLCDHDPNLAKLVRLYLQCSVDELKTMLGISSINTRKHTPVYHIKPVFWIRIHFWEVSWIYTRSLLRMRIRNHEVKTELKEPKSQRVIFYAKSFLVVIHFLSFVIASVKSIL